MVKRQMRQPEENLSVADENGVRIAKYVCCNDTLKPRTHARIHIMYGFAYFIFLSQNGQQKKDI